MLNHRFDPIYLRHGQKIIPSSVQQTCMTTTKKNPHKTNTIWLNSLLNHIIKCPKSFFPSSILSITSDH
uniref:Uncharacterized protein MANES_13G150300 n=1 Tax=Rhizophora mucronata TaxID=61149 RepID=A0A2P2MZR9_RHIMU